MKELQKKLDNLLNEIKEKGYKIDSEYKLYNPSEKIYAIEEFWEHQGAYEREGCVKRESFIHQITKEQYDTFLNGMSNDDDFLQKVFDEEIDNVNIGFLNYYCDCGEEFQNHVENVRIQNGEIYIDFGEDYRENFGGSITVKKVSQDYLNNFETIDIDTFD